MTFAVALKVNDGLVLAADSAATLHDADGNVAYVWDNANKIVNLLKGAPIGFVSWGAGGIGSAGLETLLKDLRRRFAGLDPDHADWKIDRLNYSVLDVAERVRTFLYDELYSAAYPPGTSQNPMGSIVAGYSSGHMMAEQYEISIQEDGTCPPPKEVCPQEQTPNVVWGGQSEAIQRLLFGFDPDMARVLRDKFGVPPDQVDGAIQVMLSELYRPIVAAPMPIKDAIDLAEFLVDLTIRYSHFSPYAATVGGPMEVAAITKHEGFKWIRRKYYYRRELNPEEASDA